MQYSHLIQIWKLSPHFTHIRFLTPLYSFKPSHFSGLAFCAPPGQSNECIVHLSITNGDVLHCRRADIGVQTEIFRPTTQRGMGRMGYEMRFACCSTVVGPWLKRGVAMCHDATGGGAGSWGGILCWLLIVDNRCHMLHPLCFPTGIPCAHSFLDCFQHNHQLAAKLYHTKILTIYFSRPTHHNLISAMCTKLIPQED